MNEETRNKIRKVIHENVNPILDRRVNIVILRDKVVQRRKELAEAQQRLKVAEDTLAATEKKDAVEFESLIDLISISGYTFSTKDSHDSVLAMLGAKRTAENAALIGPFVKSLEDRFIWADDR